MFEFDIEEIKTFIDEEIPTYQKEILYKALNEETVSMEFFDLLGKELTGELTRNAMLLQTGPAINKASFWDKIKTEVYIFICSDDKKYETERNLIGKNFKELATIIATAIAATFSLGTGVVIGIVTNILISVMKINKNAWCELQLVKNNAL